MTLTLLSIFVWRPAIAPMQIGALVAVLLGLAGWSYWRSIRTRPASGVILLVMRAVLIGIIGVLLMGPSAVRPRTTDSRRPCVTLLLDTSSSMRTPDAEGGVPRITYAAKNWASRELLDSLSQQCDLSARSFDDTVGSAPLAILAERPEDAAIGKVTHLAQSVESVVTGAVPNPAGSVVVVVSDGRDSDGTPIDSAAAAAKRAGIPVHTVCLGTPRNERDVALTASPMQEYLIVHEPGKILATVYHAGCEGEEVEVAAVCSGQSVSRKVRLGREAAVQVELPITHDRPGTYEYTVSVSAVPGEAVSTNNFQPVFVDVTDRRMNVLLLEGQPFWDTKFIAESLRRDERIRLTQLTQLSAVRTETIATRADAGARPPAIPRTADQFAAYDAVILGRAMERVLTPESAAALAEYVSTRGGQLIFARARAYDPYEVRANAIEQALTPLEPAAWDEVTLGEAMPEVAGAGRVHPALAFCTERGGLDPILSKLAGLSSIVSVSQLKPAATVLLDARPKTGQAAGAPAPALIAMNYGRGATLTMLGEGYFRWALVPAESKELEGFADAFWSNLVRWMVLGAEFRPDEQASLRLSTSAARIGDSVRADVSFRFGGSGGEAAADRRPELTVTDPTGTGRIVALHSASGRETRLRAEIEATTAGVYEVVLECPGATPARLTRKFNVMDMDLERLHTSADPEAMRDLAVKSGGIVLRPDRPQDLLGLITRQREAQLIPPKPEYIWDSGLAMVAILTWAGVEWIARRRGGLL